MRVRIHKHHPLKEYQYCCKFLIHLRRCLFLHHSILPSCPVFFLLSGVTGFRLTLIPSLSLRNSLAAALSCRRQNIVWLYFSISIIISTNLRRWGGNSISPAILPSSVYHTSLSKCFDRSSFLKCTP